MAASLVLVACPQPEPVADAGPDAGNGALAAIEFAVQRVGTGSDGAIVEEPLSGAAVAVDLPDGSRRDTTPRPISRRPWSS